MTWNIASIILQQYVEGNDRALGCFPVCFVTDRKCKCSSSPLRPQVCSLIAVPPDRLEALIALFAEEGQPHRVVGEVVEGKGIEVV